MLCGSHLNEPCTTHGPSDGKAFQFSCLAPAVGAQSASAVVL